MKRKLPEDAKERKKMPKRPKTIQNDRIVDSTPELPSDMWFIILEALCDDKYVTEWDMWILVAFLSSVSKRLQLECQQFKQKKNITQKTTPTGNEFGKLFSSRGWLNCLEYLDERGVKLNSMCCLLAARFGQLECLKYLLSKGVEINYSEELAPHGSLECLKYIHEYQGGKWKSPEKMCIQAASSNNLDILKFAHETGGLWNVKVCSEAAKTGRLDMLKYARENGCEWDSEVYREASREGHLNIVQYAHENGCEWNSDAVYSLACMKGHLDIVKYAFENRCPCKLRCIEIADRSGHVAIVEYFRDLGWTVEPKTPIEWEEDES